MFPEIKGVCPNLWKSFPQTLKQKWLNWKGRGSPLKMTFDGKTEEKSIENSNFAENLIVRGSCHAHFEAMGLISGPRGRKNKVFSRKTSKSKNVPVPGWGPEK